MSSLNAQAIFSQTPKQRSIYLITYSQCGDSGLDRQEFAKLMVNAWNECCRSNILHWVVSEEMYEGTVASIFIWQSNSTKKQDGSRSGISLIANMVSK